VKNRVQRKGKENENAMVKGSGEAKSEEEEAKTQKNAEKCRKTGRNPKTVQGKGKQPTTYAQYSYWMMQSVESIQYAIDEEKGYLLMIAS